MISCLGLAHLTFPLLIAFSYLFLNIELVPIAATQVDQPTLLISELVVFLLLFILYGLSCFLLLQMGPGYEDMRNKSNRLSIESIFEYQNNEQRRKAIICQLRNRTLAPDYIAGLESELAALFGKPSFCQLCKFIKAARTHHCSTCDKCVTRMQHHCLLVGGCIGAANHRNYIQFLGWAFACSIFAGLSCFINSVIYSKQLEEWPSNKMHLYILLCAVCITCSFFSLYLFKSAVDLAKKNITGVERKVANFERNNPFREDYWGKLFSGPCDFLTMNYRSEQFEMELVEQSPFSAD